MRTNLNRITKLKKLKQMFNRIKSAPNDAKPVLCEVALRKRIDKNRDEIDKWLNGDYPLDLVYMRIRMLSAQNERLISQLKAI